VTKNAEYWRAQTWPFADLFFCICFFNFPNAGKQSIFVKVNPNLTFEGTSIVSAFRLSLGLIAADSGCGITSASSSQLADY
jgi:hypothetical protein